MAEGHTTRRLHVLLWLLLGWGGLVFARLVWLQVFHHDDLLKLAQSQQQRMREVPAMRGSILDHGGQVLAKSMPCESVCVNPQRIPDPGMAADLLSRVLDLDRKQIFQRITTAKLRGSGFLWIKRKILSEEAERLRSLKLEWVEFRPEIRRFYPHHTLAAHVIGSMGMTESDGVVERGTAGVEESFDDDLAGQPGLVRVYTDVRQNPYDAVVARKPEPGANIILTIDSNLQYEAEKQLEKAVESSGARSGSIVAMNPYTGDVLAMANYPTFDPNETPSTKEPAGARSNLAIATPFEPGSVFKTVTLSAALETEKVRPDTLIDCHNGVFNLFGRIIHDAGRHGVLTAEEVFEKSSNIGAIQIGMKVGDRGMYQYITKFGFGKRTGIALPGESAGEVRRVENWTKTSIGSVAMGHEISATSLQLAVAGAAIANGGMQVTPRIVAGREEPGEAEEVFPAAQTRQILKPETAIKMRQFMEGVVLRGTGRNLANLRGYTSGGKTGTAQVYDFEHHTYTHRYNASFLGFAPVANPQIVIAVTLNDTGGGTAGYGGPVAAPVFREVAMTALRMLDVPKDLPDTELLTSAKPAWRKEDVNDLAIAGLGDPPPANDLDAREEAAHMRAVSSNTPSPPVPADSAAAATETVEDRRIFSERGNSGVVAGPHGLPRGGADGPQKGTRYVRSADRSVHGGLQTEEMARTGGDRVVSPLLRQSVAQVDAGIDVGTKVPSFRGMTLRQVLEESSAENLPVVVGGAVEIGLVHEQDPPAGAVLAPGKKIRVQFAK
jgi:cell division protein FtsI (penicillin-binding protein 3)